MTQPTDAYEAHCKKARQYLRRGQYDQAVAEFTLATELDDRRLEAYEGLAGTAFRAKRFDDAVQYFRRLIQLDPRSGVAQINLGAVYNCMGDHNKAVAELRRGLQKEKRSAEGYYNLGIAHRALDQQSMAVSAYKEALRVNPQMAEAHQNLANVYSDMGNLQQAIIHYQQALQINPDFDKAKRGLAAAEQARERAKDSISPFGRLVNAQAVRPKATLSDRRLSDIERADDRKKLSQLLDEIRDLAGESLDQLRGELSPRLSGLGRALFNTADELTADIEGPHSRYRSAVENCTLMRSNLKRKLLELRAHEELMNTPDFNPE